MEEKKYNNIFDLMKDDLYLIKIEICLKVKETSFCVEPINNKLEVYSFENNTTFVYENFDEFISKFIINGKNLISQVNDIEYKDY